MSTSPNKHMPTLQPSCHLSPLIHALAWLGCHLPIQQQLRCAPVECDNDDGRNYAGCWRAYAHTSTVLIAYKQGRLAANAALDDRKLLHNDLRSNLRLI
jgi:hypothetical protein